VQSRGAKKAGETQAQVAEAGIEAQTKAAEAGIEEQRRQFDVAMEMLKPYREAGLSAMEGLQPFIGGGQQAYQQQLALAGLLGPEAEAAAIQRVQSRPGFMEEVRAGEEALLQQAAATGGLRGGNIQRALAEYRPEMLRRSIEQEYGRFGGLAGAGLGTLGDIFSAGQASAAGSASQAQRLGQSVAGLMGEAGAAQAAGLGQIGAARAGAALGKGRAVQGVLNLPMQVLGMQYGSGGPVGFGNLFGG
jgi:hypothetical protein